MRAWPEASAGTPLRRLAYLGILPPRVLGQHPLVVSVKIFVTGSAGFVGFHLARRLLAQGHRVVGYDGMTDYYDVALKRRRHGLLLEHPGFTAIEGMLEDKALLERGIATFAPEIVIHLAAQAGVRHSIEAPQDYVSSNLVGSFNLLEAVRVHKPNHLLIASTSSVYGGNGTMPLRESEAADYPLSFYAATKKAVEAMSHSYAHLFAIPTTCFRFFTVYGPWGRPDMALFKFVAAMLADEPIEVYGEGLMRRDFTYIDDLVEAIRRLADCVPGAEAAVPGDSLSPVAPWRVVNIAGGHPVGLLDFIEAIERVLGRSARRHLLPMQPGDMVDTCADPGLLRRLIGYVPVTDLDAGVRAFIDWYVSEYRPPQA